MSDESFENSYKKFKDDSKYDFFLKCIFPTLRSKKCYFCDIHFSCDFTLKRHYKSTHRDKLPKNIFGTEESYKCEICNKPFKRKEHLDYHLKSSIHSKISKPKIGNQNKITAFLFSSVDTKKSFVGNSKFVKSEEKSMSDISIRSSKDSSIEEVSLDIDEITKTTISTSDNSKRKTFEIILDSDEECSIIVKKTKIALE